MSDVANSFHHDYYESVLGVLPLGRKPSVVLIAALFLVFRFVSFIFHFRPSGWESSRAPGSGAHAESRRASKCNLFA